MKTPCSRRARGFTLVELLVVISIIAVLASAGFAAGNSAIQKAKKTSALSTCVALESAVNNFYTEYGSMPTTSTTEGTPVTPVKTNDSTGVVLLTVLLGAETTATPLNPRGIKFLTVREGKSNKNGLIYTGTTVTGLYDPWGGGYNVAMDLDYNEQINVRPKAGTAKDLHRRCAVWSDGYDGVTATGAKTDDVLTWTP